MVDRSEFDIGIKYSEDDLKLPDNDPEKIIPKKPSTDAEWEEARARDPEYFTKNPENYLDPGYAADELADIDKRIREVEQELKAEEINPGFEGRLELEEQLNRLEQQRRNTLNTILDISSASGKTRRDYLMAIDRSIDLYRERIAVKKREKRGDDQDEFKNIAILGIKDRIEALEHLREIFEREFGRY